MRHPHPDIERGERYDQEAIETLFDTGFGYRISGINVRNDDEDERFILLFAAEGGPYDDSVSDGTFSYIGEGLPEKGDQSTDSLGNAALIAAESETVPIYFFYKQAAGDGWAYQGLVDVADHEMVSDAHGNREVLEFTMQHRDTSATGSATARQQDHNSDDTAGRTVTQTRAGVRVSKSLKQDVYERFDSRCAVTDISHRQLLTVSHVLDRADRPDIAEDPANVLLLNWTHHFAFDAGLWTFDEAGRLWVDPDYRPDDTWMHESLRARHGERLPRLKDSGVADEYVGTRNESLGWWPPN
jgi:hypothetical protein